MPLSRAIGRNMQHVLIPRQHISYEYVRLSRIRSYGRNLMTTGMMTRLQHSVCEIPRFDFQSKNDYSLVNEIVTECQECMLSNALTCAAHQGGAIQLDWNLFSWSASYNILLSRYEGKRNVMCESFEAESYATWQREHAFVLDGGVGMTEQRHRTIG